MNQPAFLQRTIIRSLSCAVIVLDRKGRITLWNLAAERMLGLSEQEAAGQNLWTLHVPGLPRPFVARLRKVVTQNQTLRGEQLEYELTNGAKGYASVAVVPIMDDGTAMGSVILFDDTTRLRGMTDEAAKLRKNNGRRQPEG
jgi:two-component system CheB/CheR fusion protein